ncbi:Lactoylglutathione lyase [Paraburkholderia caribensis MBA4]|uniref:Lactoylglutathione lyase n=1 Tax=Paraburkholderia caribensis MBA4 TaxID=1323664 RepID=A0A0P0RD57_9BURK|nr:VOC family protein [Paraburkholderia caribensis]ALL66466.1 Lactoylglutathione lyase [Paraburkholderia caribensis MBA4]
MSSLTDTKGQRKFTLSRVDHTGITVSSLQDSLRFWVDVLGFRHIYTWDFEHDAFIENLVGVKGAALSLAMVEGYGHQIELLQFHAPADRTTIQARASDTGFIHIAMYVDDLDALLERIGEAGWHPVGPPQRVEGGERDGLRLVYVRGPDGVTLEFLQPRSVSSR